MVLGITFRQTFVSITIYNERHQQALKVALQLTGKLW